MTSQSKSKLGGEVLNLAMKLPLHFNTTFA